MTDSLQDRCRAAGLRITGQRQAILTVLDRSRDHPDVEELHRRVSAVEPGISIATVYRTLNKLAEHGLIERHSFSDGRGRFETLSANHHDHFINVDTGEVVEFQSSEIERLQTELARRHGFDIVSHRLDIYVTRRLRPAGAD